MGNGLDAAEAPGAFAFETITVAGTAIGFTAGTYQPTGEVGAKRAIVTCETAQVRFRYDGTDPSATVGHLLDIGNKLEIEGYTNISLFRAIRTGGTSGALSVTFER